MVKLLTSFFFCKNFFCDFAPFHFTQPKVVQSKDTEALKTSFFLGKVQVQVHTPLYDYIIGQTPEFLNSNSNPRGNLKVTKKRDQKIQQVKSFGKFRLFSWNQEDLFAGIFVEWDFSVKELESVLCYNEQRLTQKTGIKFSRISQNIFSWPFNFAKSGSFVKIAKFSDIEVGVSDYQKNQLRVNHTNFEHTFCMLSFLSSISAFKSSTSLSSSVLKVKFDGVYHNMSC